MTIFKKPPLPILDQLRLLRSRGLIIQDIAKAEHHLKFISYYQQKRERFIQHYFTKYNSPELPPVWMVAEILSLGTWSQIFSNLKHRGDQKIICQHFKLDPILMASWLHSITYLRNLCAHHSMLWNRNFTLKPKIANAYQDQLKNNTKFSAQAAILRIFLDIASPESQWAFHLSELINNHPQLNIEKMGFEPNWFMLPFWRLFTSHHGTVMGHLQANKGNITQPITT